MMPMGFCASLPPWPRLYDAAENSWRGRAHLVTRRGVERTKIHDTISIISEPNRKPSSGDSTMNTTVLIRPAEISAPVPDLATAAPTRPPISACDDDDG